MMLITSEELNNFLNEAYEIRMSKEDRPEIRELYINRMNYIILGTDAWGGCDVKGISKGYRRIQIDEGHSLLTFYILDSVELVKFIKHKTTPLLDEFRKEDIV